MKFFKSLFFAAFLGVVNFGFAQNSFEGIISIEYKQGVTSQAFQWKINGNDVSLETNMAADGKIYFSRFIPDQARGEVLVLSKTPTGNSFYYANVQREELQIGEVRKTGVAKEIHGYSCEQIIIESDKYIIESWVADIGFDLAAYASFFQNFFDLKGLEKAGIAGFPLMSIVTDKAGNTVSKTVTSEIVEEEVSQETFAIPSGYEEIKFSK